MTVPARKEFTAETKRALMKRTVVRYKTKPGNARKSGRLIEDVFRTLQEKLPEGVRYSVLRLANASFVHFVPVEGIRFLIRPAGVIRRLSTLAVALALLSGAPSPLIAQRAPPEVTVATPLLKQIVQWEEYTGQFEALRRVEVRARVSGELVKIHFADGQTVKAGDLLFTIDPRPFEIAVESARADVARAKAQIVVTATDLGRAEQLTP